MNCRKYSKADVSSVTSLSEFKFLSFSLSSILASPRPAVVTVTLKRQDGITLGEAQVTYVANLQQVVSSPSFLRKFCEDYNSGNSSGNFFENSGGETESSRTVGKLILI